MTQNSPVDKKIRTKSSLRRWVYDQLIQNKAIKEIIPIGTRDLVVRGSKGRFRIRISKFKKSGQI